MPFTTLLLCFGLQGVVRYWYARVRTGKHQHSPSVQALPISTQERIIGMRFLVRIPLTVIQSRLGY